MAIDEPLDKHLEELEREVQSRPGLEAVRVAVQAASGGLLGIATALDSLVAGLAQKRFNERLLETLREFAKRIKQLELANTVHMGFFQSEEFQTLLFLTLQQLYTTHERPKLRMLGVGLANSGSAPYVEDNRKDHFFRIIASLNLVHIELLKRLAAGGVIRNDGASVKDEEFLRAQFLVSLGLADEYRDFIPVNTHPGQAAATVEQVLEHLKKDRFVRHIQISTLGEDFLKFVGEVE